MRESTEPDSQELWARSRLKKTSAALDVCLRSLEGKKYGFYLHQWLGGLMSFPDRASCAAQDPPLHPEINLPTFAKGTVLS